MNLYTFLDLCSGIGGGRLGLEQAGFKCIGYSDTSRLAKRTYDLMHDTSDEYFYYNLKKIKPNELPKFDLLIAGFPCQSFSVIGRKDGFMDIRGQIIFHIAQILSVAQPKCFLLENVKGLVTHNKGNTIKVILNELDKVGYNVDYKILTSLDYGVPQMRQRVYFIGVRKDVPFKISDFKWPSVQTKPALSNYLVDNNVASPERIEILKHYLKNSVNNGKYTIKDILEMEGKIIDTRMNDLRIYEGKCPTLRAQRDGILYVKNHTLYQLTGYEALLLQGFPESYSKKVKTEVSDRHLLMQAGNAMTVNVIKLLGESIYQILKEETNVAETWQDIENDCFEYLCNKYGNSAKFIPMGNHDSTRPDIQVIPPLKTSFYMETKSKNAQCGQFVLIPNETAEKFDYSKKNKTPVFSSTKIIIQHMDSNFESFFNAGTKGKPIELQVQHFYSWIIDYYSSKGVKYFITKANGSNDSFIIFPINKFPHYFDVTCTYRMKKSGSSNVAASNLTELKSILAEHDVNGELTFSGKELFLKTTLNLDGNKIRGQKYTYLFKRTVNDKYVIRRLSNTCNSNVIFSIHLKKFSQEEEDLLDFINCL